MNRTDSRKNRQGTLMIGLMTIVVIMGISAIQILPTAVVRETRSQENNLRSALSQIREAIDMHKLVDSTWDPTSEAYWNPADIPGSVQAMIADLTTDRFLTDSTLADPTIPANQWSTAAKYWLFVDNLIQNSSFESTVPPVGEECVEKWERATPAPGTTAAANADFYPARKSGQLDSFPFHNRLGVTRSTAGNSLKITK